MKNVIITGASGMVATQLALLLLGSEDYRLFLVSTSPEKYEDRYADRRVKWLRLEDLKKDNQGYDILINAGFSRSSDGLQLASSLQFTQVVAAKAKEIQVKSFVNISSQSIYGKIHAPLWTEQDAPAPDYMYALGKYASELIVNESLGSSRINYTNIRLSSVCENARFLRIFVSNVLQGIPIKVQGGTQILSFIDVRDVATALKAVIDKSDELRFEETYNLSTGNTMTILDMAKMVIEVGENEYNKNATIEIEPADIKMEVGMNSDKFKSTFDWAPQYDLRGMIESLYNYLLRKDI